MEFLLTGFTHDKDCRIFTFECISADRVWTKCKVRADLSLARKYGIALQELPLLCRGLLDRREEGADKIAGTSAEINFTEEAIRALASDRAAAKAAIPKRKAPVRPAGEHLGAAWRDQHPPVVV